MRRATRFRMNGGSLFDMNRNEGGVSLLTADKLDLEKFGPDAGLGIAEGILPAEGR